MIQFKYCGTENTEQPGYLPPELRSSGELLKKLLCAFGDPDKQNFALAFKWGETELLAFRGTAGDLSGDSGNPISPSTSFRLASVTKQLIARCVIELESLGKLSFTDRLSDIFEGLPAVYERVTVEMLLRHTSGIKDYEDMPEDGTARQVRDEDVLNYVRSLRDLYFEPGTAYRYSNTGYVLLGLVIAKKSGLSIPSAMKKYVFDPCGMTGSVVNVQGSTLIPERAYGHEYRDGKVETHDQSRWSAAIGDGGVYSNLNDILKWEDNLALSENKLSGTMFTDAILPDSTHTGYGMGIRLRKAGNVRFRTHTGITVGFNSAVAYSPDVPFRAAFLTNLSVNDPAPFIDAALEAAGFTETFD